jgi:hypothetical protein
MMQVHVTNHASSADNISQSKVTKAYFGRIHSGQAYLHGDLPGGVSVGVCECGVGLVLQEQPHHFHVAAERCVMKGRAALLRATRVLTSSELLHHNVT